MVSLNIFSFEIIYSVFLSFNVSVVIFVSIIKYIKPDVNIRVWPPRLGKQKIVINRRGLGREF